MSSAKNSPISARRNGSLPPRSPPYGPSGAPSPVAAGLARLVTVSSSAARPRAAVLAEVPIRRCSPKPVDDANVVLHDRSQPDYCHVFFGGRVAEQGGAGSTLGPLEPR